MRCRWHESRRLGKEEDTEGSLKAIRQKWPPQDGATGFQL